MMAISTNKSLDLNGRFSVIKRSHCFLSTEDVNRMTLATDGEPQGCASQKLHGVWYGQTSNNLLLTPLLTPFRLWKSLDLCSQGFIQNLCSTLCNIVLFSL